MTLSEADIARRLRLGEDSYWEFKAIAFRGDRPISPKRDDLADEIAAFANAGGGVLLCGVTEPPSPACCYALGVRNNGCPAGRPDGAETVNPEQSPAQREQTRRMAQ